MRVGGGARVEREEVLGSINTASRSELTGGDKEEEDEPDDENENR